MSTDLNIGLFSVLTMLISLDILLFELSESILPHYILKFVHNLFYFLLRKSLNFLE